MNLRERYDAFLSLAKEISSLDLVDDLLSWDQQTYMPPKGAAARSLQISTVSGVRHKLLTGDEMSEHLAALGDSELAQIGDDAEVNVREMKRLHERERKIPSDLVKEVSRVQSLALQAWTEAREKSDFSMFAPWLRQIVDLKFEIAEAIGYTGSRYNALHDEFEPGSTAEEIGAIFRSMREELVPLVRAILDSRVAREQKPLRRTFPVEKQKEFGCELLTAVGFDWDCGRVDISAHPFCSGNVSDVRLTTRYDENDLSKALFGLLHEGGHGLYEQGLDPAHEGTPRAFAVSLGIHESQSRFWENLVGRSRPFWEYAFPLMQEKFRGVMEDLDLDRWYREINRVERSMIRVEADEVTYNLHVILRFEIELDLFEKRLGIDDLPEAWNRKMEEYLGITPRSDAEGVLQDIHWSGGTFGYFPTYALGNLYASQFFQAARKAMPDLHEFVRRGDFAPILSWLRESIHRHGKRYPAAELVRVVTGEPLSAGYQIDYLRSKYGALYEL